MAMMQRLIFVMLVALAAWLPASSYASFPASGGSSQYRHGILGSEASDSSYYSSAAAACAAVCGPFRAKFPTVTACSVVSVTETNCGMSYTFSGSGPSSGNASVSASISPLSCPVNSTLSGSSCTCASGFIESGGACVPPVDPNVKKCSDAKDGVDLFTGGSLVMPGKPFCPKSGNASGCGSKVSAASATVKNGVKTWTIEVIYDGTVCTPSSGTSPDDPSPSTCPRGSAAEEINGIIMCTPLDLNHPPDTTIGDGRTTGPDGTTTDETDETTCIGSVCTTKKTKTVTPPGGPPVTTVEEEKKPKEEFCRDNPRSPMCVTSAFSGSCGSVPTCDGDAIQCAIATDQIKRNCQTLEPDNDSNSITNKAISGADGINAQLMRENPSVVNIGTFNQDGRTWSRSCPADLVVPISWATGSSATTWTLPTSKLCGPLELLSKGAVALTLLGCLVFCVRGGAGA